YLRATQADPKHVAALNRLGIVYDRIGSFELAESSFIRAIEIAPGVAYLRNNLGFSFMLHGDYSQAERALTEAIQLKPDYARARMNLGVVQARTGRIEEAVDTFSLSVPRDAAWYNVGLLCTANRQFDDAVTAFERSLRLNPRSREAQAQLGRVKLAQRDADSAASAALVKASQTMVQNL